MYERRRRLKLTIQSVLSTAVSGSLGQASRRWRFVPICQLQAPRQPDTSPERRRPRGRSKPPSRVASARAERINRLVVSTCRLTAGRPVAPQRRVGARSVTERHQPVIGVA